jgi:hypothetical protein
MGAALVVHRGLDDGEGAPLLRAASGVHRSLVTPL